MFSMSNKELLDNLIVMGRICILNEDLKRKYDVLCKSDFSIEKLVKFGIKIYDDNVLLNLILVCYAIIYKLKGEERKEIYEEVYRLLEALRSCGGNDIDVILRMSYEFNNDSIKNKDNFRNNIRRHKIYRIFYREDIVKVMIQGEEYYIRVSIKKEMSLYDKNMKLVEKGLLAFILKDGKLKFYKRRDNDYNIRKLVNNGDYDIIWILTDYKFS